LILCKAQDLSIKDEALRTIMADNGYLIGRKKEKSLQELVAVSQDHFIY
jgi:phage antirepressor YoqD-like protein